LARIDFLIGRIKELYVCSKLTCRKNVNQTNYHRKRTSRTLFKRYAQFIVPFVAEEIQQKIIDCVEKSFIAKDESKHLLETRSAALSWRLNRMSKRRLIIWNN